MAFDAHSNLALAKIVTAPSPATSGTSLTIDAAFVSLFPATPFNCTVYPANLPPTNANAEIVRVTNITSNTFTIVRAQEGTTAKAIAAGWLIANTISKKVITDIESAVVISAGTQSYQGPFTLSNSNGVSFGMSNGTVTASVAGGGVAISGGTNSQATGTVQFSNSNGVTFGLDGAGVMTASHNGLTSQSNQAVSASNGSFTFQTLNFSNANNVTFGTSAGGIITASVVPGGGGGGSVNFSAGTTSNNLASVVFSNSNSVTFGLNAGTITASVAVPPQQAISEVNAGTQMAVQAVSFANSNGITFGMSNSSVITASHNGLTSQSNQAFSADGGSSAFQTLVFANSNGISFSNSNGSVVASVGAGGAAGSISAGTTSVALGQVVFSNSNGVSFGLNGSTITASASGGTAAGATLDFYEPDWRYTPESPIEASQGSITVFPFDLPQNVNAQRINFLIQNSIAIPGDNATGSAFHSLGYALYTCPGGTGSNVLSLLTSYTALIVSETRSSNSQFGATHYYGLSNATSHSTTTFAGSATNVSTYWNLMVNGARYIPMPLALTLSPGRHWLAVSMRASTAAMTHRVFLMAISDSLFNGAIPYGMASSALQTSCFPRVIGHGYFSVTTANFPATMDMFNTTLINHSSRATIPWFNLSANPPSTTNP